MFAFVDNFLPVSKCLALLWKYWNSLQENWSCSFCFHAEHFSNTVNCGVSLHLCHQTGENLERIAHPCLPVICDFQPMQTQSSVCEMFVLFSEIHLTETQHQGRSQATIKNNSTQNLFCQRGSLWVQLISANSLLLPFVILQGYVGQCWTSPLTVRNGYWTKVVKYPIEWAQQYPAYFQ